jgi:hypothetical protein
MPDLRKVGDLTVDELRKALGLKPHPKLAGWLRRKVAANLLGIHPTTLWHWTINKRVPIEATQVSPTGEVRYAATWIEEQIAA